MNGAEFTTRGSIYGCVWLRERERDAFFNGLLRMNALWCNGIRQRQRIIVAIGFIRFNGQLLQTIIEKAKFFFNFFIHALALFPSRGENMCI